ncbi:MAG: ABC transporter substrate-binding protein [Oceanospirillales bacterium]|nr:ABC transporter substrate-binding protein [Oceanospirillales bacterium]
MKKRRISKWFFALPLLCASIAQAAPEVPDRLKGVDKIISCSGMDSPPMGFFDQASQPKGVYVDLGEEIAKRLDKKIEWRVTPFSGLIPALLAQQCDLLIEQLFDKPERREVIDIVNYMYSSQSVVVLKGNSFGIHSLDDLSGKKVAVLNGSTIRSLLEAHNKELEEAGKKPMGLLIFNSDNDAFQALRVQQADAYGTTVETAGYYQTLAPDMFDIGVPAFARILTGIGIRKDDPHLSAAVSQIIKEMQADGSYDALLAKWNIQGNRLN